jgi:hypothetical protein
VAEAAVEAAAVAAVPSNKEEEKGRGRKEMDIGRHGYVWRRRTRWW